MLLLLSGSVRQQQLRETKTKLILMGINTEAFDCVYIANDDHTSLAVKQNDAIRYPVALGTIDSLKDLKFRPELCGQILEVNCCHGTLHLIVVNSNIGGGLDLYSTSWARLTRNKPPGQTSCSVKLSSHNAFDFNGRRVTRATIDGRQGEHRGDNPYFVFDFGPIDGNKQIIFYLDDGSKTAVYLRNCEYQKQNKYWS